MAGTGSEHKGPGAGAISGVHSGDILVGGGLCGGCNPLSHSGKEEVRK